MLSRNGVASRSRRQFLRDGWQLIGLAVAGSGAVLAERILRGATPKLTARAVISRDVAQRIDREGGLVHNGLYLTGSSAHPIALQMRCTHLGCELRFDSEVSEFLCPCHRSRFDRDGQPIAGPASEPLHRQSVDIM